MRNLCPTELTSLRSEVAARIEPHLPDTEDEEFEQRCRLYLQRLRWPAGVACPRCSEDTRLLWLESRSKWHCYRCRYQFSVTAGTLFHHSHLPVWKWLVAVHLMLDSSDGITAGELCRRLGGSYKTAWFAAHRIRAAMHGRGEPLLQILVQPAEGPASAEQAAIVAGSLAGPHQHLSAKHLRAYIDERRWRIAQRGNPQAFRDTILALLGGEGLSYGQLVAGR